MKIHVKRIIKLIFIFLLTNFIYATAMADNVVVNLNVAYKYVNFNGQCARAIAINNQIPGPTLHFKQGDHVTINVYNHMDKGTSIHWHGLIVPWEMDGVSNLTQAPIPPGGVYHYQFTLNQAGTYWYHAHDGMQESLGVYGAFIIDPPKQIYKVNADIPVVLSDWSNTDPDKIMANLKKDGDFYESAFPWQPSLVHFIQSYQCAKTPAEKQDVISAYKMMQTMRMSIYDFADVPFDAFLLNGHSNFCPWRALVKVGDVVRLRFIDAGSATNFSVKMPGAMMRIISVDGQDVVPLNVDHFDITPGETYDVLVKITSACPYLIYAESSDQLGAAEGGLVVNPNQMLNFSHVIPFPEPKPVMMNMAGMNMSGMSMNGMSGMNMSSGSSMSGMNMSSGSAMQGMNMSSNSMKGMNMSGMNMPGMKMGNMDSMKMSGSSMSGMNMSSSSSMPGMNMSSGSSMNNMTSDTSDDNKYKNLKSLVPTNDPNKPYQVIKIELGGYMSRYIWFINGVPEYRAKPIEIIPGKRYRLIFINNTMMHHPMHVHGHWFILRNGYGAFDPKLHTIDLAPNETLIADMDAIDNYGLWFFHCHNSYHMMTGMTTEFVYPNTAYTWKTGWQSFMEGISGHSGMSMSSMTQNDQLYVPSLPVEPAGIYNATFIDLNAGAVNTYQGTANILWGTDYDKIDIDAQNAELEDGSVSNANVDLFYWHLLNEFWAVKGGANYVYRLSSSPYWQPGVGIAGLMPYFIDTDVRAYFHSGSAKLDIDLSRDTQITNKFFIRLGVESLLADKSVAADDISTGVNQMIYDVRPYYALDPGLDLYVQYEYSDAYGNLADDMNERGFSPHDNTVSIGFTLLF